MIVAGEVRPRTQGRGLNTEMLAQMAVSAQQQSATNVTLATQRGSVHVGDLALMQ